MDPTSQQQLASFNQSASGTTRGSSSGAMHVACHNCRTAGVMCDGQMPKCGRCIETGQRICHLISGYPDNTWPLTIFNGHPGFITLHPCMCYSSPAPSYNRQIQPDITALVRQTTIDAQSTFCAHDLPAPIHDPTRAFKYINLQVIMEIVEANTGPHYYTWPSYRARLTAFETLARPPPSPSGGPHTIDGVDVILALGDLVTTPEEACRSLKQTITLSQSANSNLPWFVKTSIPVNAGLFSPEFCTACWMRRGLLPQRAVSRGLLDWPHGALNPATGSVTPRTMLPFGNGAAGFARLR